MRIFLDDRQNLHRGQFEFTRGQMMPCFESPARLDNILEALKKAGFDSPRPPDDHGMEAIHRVHDPAFVQFLQTAWDRWQQRFGNRDALPWNWPTRSMPSQKKPDTIEGEMAYYALDAGAPITAHTWTSAYWSAQCALSAAHAAKAGQPAMALCRPPGHHAAADVYGAYCYLNNAAIAAQALREEGFARVAVLDVDYHHGNGTQSIFYARSDVITASIHAHPQTAFPYFSGYADEQGIGAGKGTNLNLPLPDGTTDQIWLGALETALAFVKERHAEALVIALGLDTADGDPVSTFKLTRNAYSKLGAAFAATNLPTMFVLEGGYALDLVGDCLAATLQGFCARR